MFFRFKKKINYLTIILIFSLFLRQNAHTMALTISLPTIANGWLPAHNDINYIISSTEDIHSDFCYIIDIQVNGTSAIKLRRYPVAVGIPIVLNVRQIVANFLKTTFPNNRKGFSSDYASIVLIVSEYYEQETQSSSASNPINVWNASASFSAERKGLSDFVNEFAISLIGELYIFGRPMAYHLANDGNPLIYRLLSVSLKDDANMYSLDEGMVADVSLMMHSNDGNYISGDFVVVCGFDKNKVMTHKFVQHNQGIDASAEYMLYHIQIGSKILNASDFTNAYYDRPFPVTNMSGCEYILVYTTDNPAGNVLDEDTMSCKPLVFKINHCKESFGIHYASSEGGWGFVQCNCKMVEETSIETTTLLKPNPLGMNGWADDARLVSATNVRAQGTIKLNSGWVEDAVADDIRDMLTSPNIFIEHWKNGQLEYIPVTLVNATYMTAETKAVNLRNYEFTFAESYFKNTIGGE